MRIAIASDHAALALKADLRDYLIGLGHEVAVWNRTAAKTAPLAGAGAQVVATPEALAARAEAVITILTDAGWKYISADFWEASDEDLEGSMERTIWW